jgi:rSAM/selenodomain-associated transferase 2
MKISIIIPMLNEIDTLADLLDHLLMFKHHDCEIIFVDGGSCDGSAALVEIAGFSIIHSTAGRAHQMNIGAAKATGEVMVFLHADTRLPIDAIQVITHATKDWQHQWGRFDVVITGQSAMLKIVAFMMNCRSRWSSIATGDQAIFIKRSLFICIGGFPEQPLMEDIELCRRLRDNFQPACVREKVFTSGRRWEARGVWRTIFLMWKLRWHYWRGVSADEIAAAYR